MVYRGKPSANCKPCRDRRIKCNRKQPQCGQCLRRGITCHGYRLPEALRIRDQTDEVTRKLQECEQPGESLASSSLLDDTQLSIINLAPSSSDLKNRGLCYFMSYYGRPLSETLTNNTSYSLLTKEAVDDPIVLAVSTAIGLAALANIHHDDSLAVQARQSYSTVIGSLTQALEVPFYTTSDSALITSLLLSIFEMLMCGEYQMIGVWGRHIDGSTAIIRLRGPDQLQTRRGIGLFTQARRQAITHCIQTGTKVPDFFKEWPSQALPGPLSADFLLAEDLTCLSIKLTDLNAVLRDGSIQDYGSVLKVAHAIDEQLAQWGARFQDRWGYTTVNSKSVLQNDRRSLIQLPTEDFYVYKNMWSCNQWNIYRVLRIMANGFTLAMADKLPEDAMNTYSFDDKCTEVINDMAWGILASVPYCLGAIDDENVIGQASPMNSLGALNSFMKLYMFAKMTYVSDTLRIKAVKTLRQIGEIYGIRFSSMLAETIKR